MPLVRVIPSVDYLGNEIYDYIVTDDLTQDQYKKYNEIKHEKGDVRAMMYLIKKFERRINI
jgi:hypothetical protein